MRKSVFTVFISAFVLVGCGDFVGVSEEHPLGEFGEIDELLAGEKKFKKTSDKIGDPECFLDVALWEEIKDLTYHKYRDVGSGSVAGDIHVKIGVDGSGRVCAIVGRFNSRRAVWTDSGGRVESFIGKMWEAVSGGEASFTKMNRPGGYEDEYLFAEFDKGTVAGKWEKVPTTRRASDYNTLWDQVLIWRK